MKKKDTMLTETFLQQYTKKPPFGGNGLGEFIYLRTYSRWLEDQQRRETWEETCKRVVDYSIGLAVNLTEQERRLDAEALYDAMYNLRVQPSGRSLWIGGTRSAQLHPSANFNCAFTVIDSLKSFTDIFHLLMVGAGVGFRILPDDVAQLPRVYKPELVFETFTAKHPSERLEYTDTYRDNTTLGIIVGDSKGGWVSALDLYLQAITDISIKRITINFDSVRPKGELLKTFGGRASGHESISTMFALIHNIILASNGTLSTVDALDICNIIGFVVVVGGVRRTAEIALFDPNDVSVLDSKYDMWTPGTVNYGKDWRAMSNNSIFFQNKPTKDQLMGIFQRISNNGEPGFINAKAAAKRRPNFEGLNPCAEILLDKNGVCNLSEVNLPAHIIDGKLNMSLLHESICIAVKIGMRLTNVTLDLPEWDMIQKRDRLVGVSLSGQRDFQLALNLTDEQLSLIFDELRIAADDCAYEEAYRQRIPLPLLVTTVKPSGTLSLLPTISPGIHDSYAPYYIRRVRISGTDPLAETMYDLGYAVYPEYGSNSLTPEAFDQLAEKEQREILANTATWVIEFPVQSSATKPATSYSACEQFQRYLNAQKHWTQHNTSITIYYHPDEVSELVDMLLTHWDEYIAVSFLPHTNSYKLAPLEAITEDEYNQRKDAIKDHEDITATLTMYERAKLALPSDLMDSDCDSGICPIR